MQINRHSARCHPSSHHLFVHSAEPIFSGLSGEADLNGARLRHRAAPAPSSRRSQLRAAPIVHSVCFSLTWPAGNDSPICVAVVGRARAPPSPWP